ncbi:MAG: LysE family translocator [Microvirga sp.]|nr:LysE family translocator [Microvirga sp.]
METQTLVIAAFLFAISASFSPGPNNFMLVTSGAKFGLGRTWAHIAGVALGFPLMIVAVGVALGGVFLAIPVLHDVLAIVGGLYMLWLAWTLIGPSLRGDPGSVEGSAVGRPIGFVEAALFQWVNPKAWVIATGAVAAYTTQDGFAVELAVFAAAFCIVGFASSITWASLGQLIARFLDTPLKMRIFNWTLAALLVASIVPVLWSRAG